MIYSRKNGQFWQSHVAPPRQMDTHVYPFVPLWYGNGPRMAHSHNTAVGSATWAHTTTTNHNSIVDYLCHVLIIFFFLKRLKLLGETSSNDHEKKSNWNWLTVRMVLVTHNLMSSVRMGVFIRVRDILSKGMVVKIRYFLLLVNHHF